MVDINTVINEFLNYYSENCQGKTMEYAYGFFDALGILREIKEKILLQ